MALFTPVFTLSVKVAVNEREMPLFVTAPSAMAALVIVTPGSVAFSVPLHVLPVADNALPAVSVTPATVNTKFTVPLGGAV